MTGGCIRSINSQDALPAIIDPAFIVEISVITEDTLAIARGQQALKLDQGVKSKQ